MTLNGVPLNSSFKTTDKTPTITGRVYDPLSGATTNNQVAAGPSSAEVTIEKKGFLGVYSVVSVTNVNLPNIYFANDNSLVTDNSKQLASKYADFSFTPETSLEKGEYRVTLRGHDRAGNSNESTNFIVSIVDQVTEVGSTQVSLPTSAPTEKPTPTTTPSTVSSPTVTPKPSSSPESTSAPQENTSTISTQAPSESLISKATNGVINIYWSFIGTLKTAFSGVGNFIAQAFGRVGSTLAFLGNKIAGVRSIALWFNNSTSGIRKNIAMTLDVLINHDPTKILDVQITKIANNQAVITWTTNKYTINNKVNYGETLSYGGAAFAPDREKTHTVTLTNLKPNTKYVFEVMSQGNNYTYDSNFEFTTLPATP